MDDGAGRRRSKKGEGRRALRQSPVGGAKPHYTNKVTTTCVARQFRHCGWVRHFMLGAPRLVHCAAETHQADDDEATVTLIQIIIVPFAAPVDSDAIQILERVHYV